MIIPPAACANLGSSHCVWMLWVNEPRETPPVTVGYQIGTGGTLAIPYPSFCGVLQADKLVTIQADLLSGQGQVSAPPVTVAPPPGLPSQATLDASSGDLNDAPVNASIPPTSWIPSELIGGASILVLAFLLKTKRLFK
jgi:hypothetical protein